MRGVCRVSLPGRNKRQPVLLALGGRWPGRSVPVGMYLR